METARKKKKRKRKCGKRLRTKKLQFLKRPLKNQKILKKLNIRKHKFPKQIRGEVITIFYVLAPCSKICRPETVFLENRRPLLRSPLLFFEKGGGLPASGVIQWVCQQRAMRRGSQARRPNEKHPHIVFNINNWQAHNWTKKQVFLRKMCPPSGWGKPYLFLGFSPPVRLKPFAWENVGFSII